MTAARQTDLEQKTSANERIRSYLRRARKRRFMHKYESLRLQTVTVLVIMHINLFKIRIKLCTVFSDKAFELLFMVAQLFVAISALNRLISLIGETLRMPNYVYLPNHEKHDSYHNKADSKRHKRAENQEHHRCEHHNEIPVIDTTG